MSIKTPCSPAHTEHFTERSQVNILHNLFAMLEALRAIAIFSPEHSTTLIPATKVAADKMSTADYRQGQNSGVLLRFHPVDGHIHEIIAP